MKNITVSVDEETYCLAEEWAERRGMTISAMIKDYLSNLPQGAPGAPGKPLSEVIADFRAKGIRLSVSDNVSREELYDRDALR